MRVGVFTIFFVKMKLLLLFLAVFATAAATAEWTPYADATASTAKQDFSGKLLLCDVALGWPNCGIVAECRGNCAFCSCAHAHVLTRNTAGTHAFQQLVMSQEMVTAGVMFCIANVRIPRQG
jgi:hypothetical protein